MSTNNKQRRAAKRRKRARQQRPSGPEQGRQRDAGTSYALAELVVTSTIRRISGRKVDDAELLRHAESMVRRVVPTPGHVIETVLLAVLAGLVDTVARGGWGPADLQQLVRRHDPRHLPTLAAVLHEDRRLPLHAMPVLASHLQVAAILSTAPLLAPGPTTEGATARTESAEHPRLARVRALLAKAESTEFADEAEALSAKAQELISRYSLGLLLEQGGGERSRTDVAVRRLWLDSP